MLELEAAREVFLRLGPSRAPPVHTASCRPAETHGLSGREFEVLVLVAAARSNREIATQERVVVGVPDEREIPLHVAVRCVTPAPSACVCRWSGVLSVDLVPACPRKPGRGSALGHGLVEVHPTSVEVLAGGMDVGDGLQL